MSQTILWYFLIQLIPPWKPDVQNAWDTKYIPDEFAREPLDLSPSQGFHDRQAPVSPFTEDGELPHFEKFSYHGGSRNVYGSYFNGSSSAVHHSDETF